MDNPPINPILASIADHLAPAGNGFCLFNVLIPGCGLADQ
jgi:hypothetical protein